MTTYSWSVSGGVGGASASNIISFSLTLADGVTPDTAAAPVFTYYGARSGTSPMAPPIIYHRGLGVYVATVPESDANTGVVWMVTTGSLPARYVGAVSTLNDPLVAFLLEDATGALWTGANPTFELYANADGTPRPAQPTILKGDRIGVYAFTGTADDATSGTIFKASSAGAFPSFVQGDMTGTQPVTFIAAQQSLYKVVITTNRSILDTPNAADASNYTVYPADALVLQPSVVTANVINATTVELGLSVELVTGTYSVEVAANTWYTPDNFATNSTAPVGFVATGAPPVVVSAYAPTLSTIRVIYSKKMRHANPALVSDALRVANYTVSGKTITGVVAFNDFLYELTLSTPMVVLSSHTLSITGPRDLPGNTVVPFSQTLPYGSNPELVAAPADVIGNTVLVPAEWRLRRPFQYPTLEFFRQHVLSAASDSEYMGSKGRALLFFTQDTDIRAAFIDLFGVTFKTPEPSVVQKRGALEVYEDVGAQLDRLREKALSELRQARVPEVYTAMLEPRLMSHNYLDKVSAYAAVVLLAAAVLE